MPVATSDEMTHEQKVRKFGGFITIGERRYRRFIPYPGPVNDDTSRCIRCGQIDEAEYHIDAACKGQFE